MQEKNKYYSYLQSLAASLDLSVKLKKRKYDQALAPSREEVTKLRFWEKFEVYPQNLTLVTSVLLYRLFPPA